MDSFIVLILILLLYLLSNEVLNGQQVIKVENKDVVLGGSFIFKCVFNDTLTGSVVVLQKEDEVVFSNGKNQTGKDKRITIESGGQNTISLKLENVSQTDNALFQCLRKQVNETDTFADTKYNLTVLEPPQVKLSPIDFSDQKVWKGDPVDVTCDGTGKPVPKVWWINSSMAAITIASNESSTLTYTPETVKNITLTCVAENSVGNITTAISFHVRDIVPSKPLNFKIARKTDSYDNTYQLTLSWQPSALEGKNQISYYHILKTPKDENSKPTVAPTTRAKTYSLSVFRNYNFSLKACNDFGCGPPAQFMYQLIDESVPKANISEYNVTSRNLSMVFVLSKKPTSSQEFTYTKICSPPACKENMMYTSCKCSKTETCVSVNTNTNNTVDITDLHPFCNYTFIGHYMYKNYKLTTVPVLVQTQTEASGPAEDVAVNYIEGVHSKLNVSWKRPVNIYSPFVKYKIKYCCTKNKTYNESTNFVSTGEDSVNKRYSYVLGNLTGYTNYTIHVVVEASDVAESGDNAIVTGQAKYKRTDESTPGPPALLEIVSLTSNSVLLKWDAPDTVPLVTQYSVTFAEKDKESQKISELTKITDEPTVTLTLTENTNYTVKVFSVLVQERTKTRLESAPAVSNFTTEIRVVVVPSKGNKMLIVVTSIMLFLVLLVLVGSMCYCRRKDLCKSSYSSNFYVPPGFTQETEFQPLPFSIRQTIRTAEANRVPMTFEEFEKHISELHSNSDYLFSEEYASLGPSHPDKNEVTFENSKSEANRNKNRYQDIVAYDQTRVRLMSLEGVVGSNYINANYVDGYGKSCAYIATQAPLSHTLGDFWRMVWETKSRTIIMLTNLTERGRKKCEQYWPNSGTVSYKNYDVTLESTVYYSNYTIRKLLVTRVRRNTEARESPSEPGEERVVWQYHFTEWPDFGVPQNRGAVLGYILHCRQYEDEHSEPPIVHCSAGVGRTGTYIMLDSLMRRYDHLQDIEVFCTLKKLRKQRNYLVQQEVQYIFIHDAILDYMKSGVTQIPLDNLEMKLNQDNLLETLQKEWKVLDNFSIPTHFCCCGLRPCNRPKNRDPEIIPVDSRRVRLLVQAAIEGSDYINASYIDGYHHKQAYIVTQHPLKTTVVDFWRMIWETNSLIIVNLMENEEIEQDDIFSYIPLKETEATYGNYHIQIEEERVENNYICRTINFTNKEVQEIDSNKRQICQYHFCSWAADFYPRMAFLFELLVDVAQCQEKVRHKYPRRRSFVQVRDLDPPIVIHCKCGVGRSGMFAALLHLKEQIEDNYAMIDIFATVHNLLSYRPFLIQNMGQYDYLYKAVLSLKHYVIKSKPTPLTMDL